MPVSAGGTALIEGIVLEEATGEPLAGVEVRLTVQLRLPSFATRTGEDGRFRFENVPEGNHEIYARRLAPSRLLAALDIRRTSREVRVRAGERLSDLTIRLAQGGTIAGTVYDTNAQPVARANVEIAYLYYGSDGGRRLRSYYSYAQDATDESGTYRITGVEAGEYYVFVRGFARDGPKGPGLPRLVPTYYPGTNRAEFAVPVHVASGISTDGVDITLEGTPVFRVSGRLINPFDDGRPMGPIRLELVRRNRRIDEGLVSLGESVSGDGEFALNVVPPGSYTLFVGVRFNPADDPNKSTYAMGRIDFDVVDVDVSDLTIVIEPNVHVDSRLVLADSVRRVSDLDNMTLGIVFTPTDGKPAAFAPYTARGSWKSEDDGTFWLGELSRGTYRVRVYGFPDGYYLSSLRWAGEDFSERDRVIVGQPPGDLVIEMSAAGGSLGGTVENEAGEPVVSARVVIKPVPETANPDRVVTVLTDGRGRYDVRGIPPGNYRVFAFDQIPYNAWLDRAYMDGMDALGVLVELHKRDRKVQPLTVIRQSN